MSNCKIETKILSSREMFRLVLRKRSRTNPNIRPHVSSAWVSSAEDAWKFEKALHREIDKTIERKGQEGLSWGRLIDKWEIELRRSRDFNRKITMATIENYIHGLRTHTKSWWNRPANSITRADIRELYMSLNTDGHSRSMEQKMRSALNGIFVWAIETRQIAGVHESPAKGISLIGRKEESVPEILTLGETRKLLNFAKVDEHEWFEVWAMALHTGMRNGELFALEWSDVDLENKMILVSKSYDTKTRSVGPTKGRYWRHIPINSEVEELLRGLRLTSSGRVHVLPRLKEWEKGYQAKILRSFCRNVGLPSIRFHTLRACFATALIRDGVSPQQVKKIGGWKDNETMDIYVRLSGVDIQGATDKLKLLPPKEIMGKVVNLFADRDD